MPYKQFILESPKIQAEASEELLTELGALAVTLEDAHEEPLFEPSIGSMPLWQNTKIIALFEEPVNLELIKLSLEQSLDPSVFATLIIETVEEKDWVLASLDQFKPQCFGERLWICPSWCTLDLADRTLHNHNQNQDRDRDHNHNTDRLEPIIVLLDPGLAFGTGNHPTTRLCLEWLAKHSVKDKVVMDYGCGSGILGIAALKLGAKQLIAVDHDPQALLSTKENAKLNAIDISHSQTMISLLPEDLPKLLMVDLILANILANPLIELAEKLTTMLRPNGQIVLSGILASQIDLVIKAYEPYVQNFVIECLDEWARIHAITRNFQS